MAEKYGIRSKWGLPKTPGFDDNFMTNHTGGSNVPFQSYGDGTVTAYGPPLPRNTAWQQESEYLVKGSSQNAVAGATGNNMKVGMNASANAQQNLLNPKMMYQSPEISNVKEVYNSNNALPKPERPTVGLDDSYETMLPDSLEDLNMVDTENPFSLFDENLSEEIAPIPKQPVEAMTAPPASASTTPAATEAAKSNVGMQAAAAGLAIAGGVAKHQELQKVIGTLKDQRRGLEGAIGGMANETNAAMKASRQNLSEERRQIGALENDALYNQLEKARSTKTGGLSSGSVKQMQDELTDSATTRSDISLSRAEDRAFAAEDAFMAEQFNLRSQRNAQLEELNKQIAEAEKEKTWGPINSIVDAGISVVSVANPAVGLGLSIGKSLLTS